MVVEQLKQTITSDLQKKVLKTNCMHTASALPAQFAKILVDGEVKERYEPIRFQRVANLKIEEKLI